MKVEIIRPSGFCAGVNKAFEIVKKAKQEHPNKQIYILGLLVHNSLILERLEKENIKTVYSINDIPEGEVIIFSAHGHSELLQQEALDKNLIIYDTTCVKVQKCLDKIKEETSNGNEIIYIGVKNHQECLTALSISGKVHFYDVKGEFDYCLSNKKPIVINQTSLNINDLKNIHEDIKKHYPEAIFIDEICEVTKVRQNAILSIGNDVDYIIVVGDTKSSNSTRLYELAKLSHHNKESIMVNSLKELDINLCKNKNHIVIASGTSTPDELVDVIYNSLNNI